MTTTRGLLLGKFLPPHLGHLHLMEFARSYADKVTIVVGTLEREPISGALRYEWMKELAPWAHVVHLDEELPQAPEEHPDFWPIWQTALKQIHPEKLDYVFASEAYGAKLAEVLDAEFVPVDPARTGVPISATAIREDPFTHWDLIPRCVRPYFVKRVCIFGPESTGKSTLSKQLAAHYNTIAVPEYARALLETIKIEPVDTPALIKIARGQVASEEALARSANRILFCDTDVLSTVVWSHVLTGRCERWMEESRRPYDLTLLTDIDLPWVADPIRYRPDDRASFLKRCIEVLESAGRPYIRVSGTGKERLEAAIRAVDEMIQSGKRISSSVV